MTEVPSSSGRTVRLALVSFALSMVVLGIKGAAWWTTGSVVLLADAAESSLDVVTALALVLAVRLSSKPPDEGHPWGHGKIEYFTSGFQGALILAAGLGVAWEGVRTVLRGPEVLDLGLGMGLSALATALNLALALSLVRAGRRWRSPALLADGQHNLADVITTLGGWTGLGLAWLTGVWLLDPLVALAVSVHILWTGGRLVKRASDGLMDAAIPEDELTQLRTALEELLEDEPETRLRDLRARRSSHRTFAEAVLWVPGATSVEHAHQLCDALEARAAELLPGAELHVHVEPTPAAPR